MRPAHIGIVGCSAEGAALCYRTICLEGEALFGVHAHPEISMHTLPLADYVTHLDAGDTAAVAGLMLTSAHRLAAAGADFLICPDNTIHAAMPYVVPVSPRPWLHIAEEVVVEAKRLGFRRLGITGTIWLTESDVYPSVIRAAGLEFVRPPEKDRQLIGTIIMEELVRGQFKPASIAALIEAIDRLAGAGCDAVILGCTELPLVISDENSPLPTLDSTRLLARAALRHARGDQ